jgi:pimeloyl-ACP methyl ester carboxylesterase
MPDAAPTRAMPDAAPTRAMPDAAPTRAMPDAAPTRATMMKAMLAVLVSTAAATLAAPVSADAQGGGETMTIPHATPEPLRSGHVDANGVRYYFQVHGEGEPLLLLHGGLGSIDMFGPVLPMLAEGREVIGVDLHGHGRTALGDRAIDVPDMADDMAVVLADLGYGEVDVLGYSLGAGVALRLAVQHPGIVRRLALVSGAFSREGFFPEMLPMQAEVGAGMAEAMMDTPMYRSYVAVAPHPEDFPKLLDRMGELMRTPYDWSEDVKSLSMPVMLVYGDSDMYRPEHIVQFYQLLGGGLRDAGWMRENMSRNRLAILPDLTHYEIFLSPAMAAAVLPFLNGQSGAGSWGEGMEGG